MNNKQPLLRPYMMGDLQLKNSMIMAPLTRSRADNADNVPTALHVAYYRQRASAGLIITEGTQVSKKGVGYINTPGIYSTAQVAGWKAVTDAVHKEDGKIFAQIWHVGRISHPDFHDGELPHAPDDINPATKAYTPGGFKETVTPKAMTIEEIKDTVADFKRAAQNAVDAGFDGVEIHSSNGYLFHQFFNKTSNKRTDEYGGSMENRMRFFFEVLDEVSRILPKNRIGVRFNPSLHNVFGMEADEETIPLFDTMIAKLNDYNLAYVHLSEPFTDVSGVPFLKTEIAKHYRPIYKGTLMINNGFDQEKGNKIIEDGLADLVSFGKLFISNPHLPERFEDNAEITPWDEATFYTPGSEGYTDYPVYEKATASVE